MSYGRYQKKLYRVCNYSAVFAYSSRSYPPGINPFTEGEEKKFPLFTKERPWHKGVRGCKEKADCELAE